MSEELYRICESLTREIGQLGAKPDISPTELDRLYKAVDIVKDIKTIEAMEDAGYSNTYTYDDGMRYMRGNSYARGRDSMGRYTSRDEGPMHDKEHLKRKIEEMQARLDRM